MEMGCSKNPNLPKVRAEAVKLLRSGRMLLPENSKQPPGRRPEL